MTRFKIRISLNGTFRGWWTNGGAAEAPVTLTNDEQEASIWYWHYEEAATYLATGSFNYLFSQDAEPLQTKASIYRTSWVMDGSHLRDGGRLVGTDGRYFYANDQNVVDLELVEA